MLGGDACARRWQQPPEGPPAVQMLHEQGLLTLDGAVVHGLGFGGTKQHRRLPLRLSLPHGRRSCHVEDLMSGSDPVVIRQ